MSNIQKEIGQLEHWLIHLSDDTSKQSLPTPSQSTLNNPTPSHPTPSIDLLSLQSSIQQLSTQINSQQHTLNNIIDRIEIIEGTTREIHIDQDLDQTDDQDLVSNHNDSWLTSSNLPDNNISLILPATTLTVHKSSHVDTPVQQSTTPPSLEIAPDNTPSQHITLDDEKVDATIIEEVSDEEEGDVVDEEEEAVVEDDEGEVVDDDVTHTHPVTTTPSQIIIQTNHLERTQNVAPVVEEVVPVVEEEAVEEDAVEEEVLEEEAVEEEAVEEEAVEEEAVEEEVEEEGIELEEIEFKGVTYYKDGDDFIYTIDSEGQPSDPAVGYWREKTQAVVFYKK